MTAGCSRRSAPVCSTSSVEPLEKEAAVTHMPADMHCDAGLAAIAHAIVRRFARRQWPVTIAATSAPLP
jgi:hypothetical protein